MSLAKQYGLADPRCQLYMLFYYVGPTCLIVTLRTRRSQGDKRIEDGDTESYGTAAAAIHSQSPELGNGGCVGGGGCGRDEIIVDNAATLCGEYKTEDVDDYRNDDGDDDDERYWPSLPLLIKASSIAIFDIFAQSMVYTGNTLAGPTIFSIIYSSVTIWAAIYSKFILGRTLSLWQWWGIGLVVVGLSLTSIDSASMGQNVFWGACMIVIGSSLHGLTYVFSEKIMKVFDEEEEGGKRSCEPVLSSPLCLTSSVSMSTASTRSYDVASHRVHVHVPQESTSLRPQQRRRRRRRRPEVISARANCAIQGLVATIVLLAWQVIYTFPHIRPLVLDPMVESHTSPLDATLLLCAIALSNLLHSFTFFVTLKYLPGGATSAGVLKGLQAMLVFCVSSVFLCGRYDGQELCWSTSKAVSLVIVLCGIAVYTQGMIHGEVVVATKKMDVDGVL